MVPRRVLGAAIAVAALALAGAVAGLAADDQAQDPAKTQAVANEDDGSNAGDSHAHAHSHGSDEANDSSRGEVRAVQPRPEHRPSDRPGEVPSRAEAGELEHQLESFVVEGDDGLAQMDERGYIEGEGTLANPYVISGFRVTEDLKIKDTSKPLVVENSYIEGQLSLNFNGDNVYVHHNYIHDLRVNENVERDASTTGGLIANNDIAFIGQLRHWAGTFAHNDVGPRPDDVVTRYLSDTGPAQVPDGVVWNFDGYHGAHVHNNTVRGKTIVQLHGHFHGSCQACPHHNHEDKSQFPPNNEREDGLAPASRHSIRFHTIDLENNTFDAPNTRTALRVFDEDHAGDDQTAASEPNEYLEDEHEHHQYVRVAHNDLHGGRLFLDVVNARDERHTGHVQEALVHVTGNHVDRTKPRDSDALIRAYEIEQARQMQLVARGNTYNFDAEDSNAPGGYGWAVDGEPADATGFYLEQVDTSNVRVVGTQGKGATYGITEDEVAQATELRLIDNDFGASEEDRHDA